MSQDDAIYDLGEVDLSDRKVAGFPPVFSPESGGGARRLRTRGASRSSARVGPQLAGSLSLFVPGLGHLVAGEPTWGLFYAASLGFCAASMWAAFSMRASLLATMKVLELRPEILVIAVAGLVVTTMLLHLAAISHAQLITGGADEGDAAHPIVAGFASLLVPGWGQILAGHSKRATLFVGAMWLIAGAWLAATPIGMRALHTLGVDIPASLRDDWGNAILIASPVIVWIIAVYDAARR